MESIHEKTEAKKSRATVPLSSYRPHPLRRLPSYIVGTACGESGCGYHA
jgi:hypothetical protein